MLHLCSVPSNKMTEVFGSPISPEGIKPKYKDLQVVMVGQKPDCSSFLLLSDQVVTEFTKLKEVPEGYNFTFRQEWGLTINKEVLDRVITTLRTESYPPMGEYLDAVVKGDEEQMQKYVADCEAVKVKYPRITW